MTTSCWDHIRGGQVGLNRWVSRLSTGLVIPTSGNPTTTSFCTQFEDRRSGEDNEWLNALTAGIKAYLWKNFFLERNSLKKKVSLSALPESKDIKEGLFSLLRKGSLSPWVQDVPFRYYKIRPFGPCHRSIHSCRKLVFKKRKLCQEGGTRNKNRDPRRAILTDEQHQLNRHKDEDRDELTCKVVEWKRMVAHPGQHIE